MRLKTVRKNHPENGNGFTCISHPVNPWLIHVYVWQKPLQYCKVIILQLIKINGKKIFLNGNGCSYLTASSLQTMMSPWFHGSGQNFEPQVDAGFPSGSVCVPSIVRLLIMCN